MYRITAINGDTKTVIEEPSPESTVRTSSWRLTDEINQIPSLELSLMPDNPCFAEGMNDRKTLIEAVNTLTNETEFEGVLLRSSCEMTSAGKLYRSCICEGYLGYLCDTVQPYRHYGEATVTEFLTALLDSHNAQTSENKRIYLGLCDISGNTHSKTTAYRTTLEEIRVNLIERIGGEIRIRHADGRLVLDYLAQYGVRCGTAIELANNLQSLEVSSDSSNIITRLIPLGYQPDPGESAERLDISSVNDGKFYIDDDAAIERYGIIVGTAVFDDITLPENLLTAGREYMENNNRVKKSYAAQVLDLSLLDESMQGIYSGNTYRFRNPLLGLDEELRLVKRVVSSDAPHKPQVEIGDRSERITDIAVHQAQLMEYELPKQRTDILASAKATASALIRAGINGYVVVNGNEILIMDTPSKETATRVWRWNSSGFGYSSTGYDGSYGTAITMDGAIVADYITAGVLRGMEINNGNGTFRVDEDGTVEAAAMNITGGSISIETDSASLSVIDLRYQGQSITYQNAVSAYGIVVNMAENGHMKSAAQIFPDMISIVGEGQERMACMTAGGITLKGGISAGGNVTAEGNILYMYGGNMHNVADEIQALKNAVFGG